MENYELPEYCLFISFFSTYIFHFMKYDTLSEYIGSYE